MNHSLTSFRSMRGFICETGRLKQEHAQNVLKNQDFVCGEHNKACLTSCGITLVKENFENKVLAPHDRTAEAEEFEQEQACQRNKFSSILSCRRWEDYHDHIPSFKESVDGDDDESIRSIDLPAKCCCRSCDNCWGHHLYCEDCFEGCCDSQQQCNCLRCGDCGCMEDDCMCDWCHYCHRRGTFCVCPYCKNCKRQGIACICDYPCRLCHLPQVLCNCERCRICNRRVWPHCDNDDEQYYCLCSQCRLCNQHPNQCSCSEKYLKTQEVRFESSFIQIVHPEPMQGHKIKPIRYRWDQIRPKLFGKRYEQDKNVLILHGEDFHTILIPTWRGFKDHTKERVVNMANCVIDMVKSSLIGRVYRAVRLCVARLFDAYYAERSWYNRGAYIEVARVQHVRWMLDELAKVPRDDEPHLGFDLEGWNLGRDGTTAYLQIRDYFHGVTYLIDVLVLDQATFTTATSSGLTLQRVLEDSSMVKIIFDCRQDSDALFDHFDVKLAGVIDVQYMCMLTMEDAPYYRPNLLNTISEHAGLIAQEKSDWEQKKSFPLYKRFYLFLERPCAAGLKTYATNDVSHLNKVYANFRSRLTERGMELVREWTQKELEDTWEEDFVSTRAIIRLGFRECWQEELVHGRHPTCQDGDVDVIVSDSDKLKFFI